MKVTALKRDHSCGRDGRRGAEWRSNAVRSVLVKAGSGRKHGGTAVGQRNRDVGLCLPQPIAVARMLVSAFDPDLPLGRRVSFRHIAA